MNEKRELSPEDRERYEQLSALKRDVKSIFYKYRNMENALQAELNRLQNDTTADNSLELKLLNQDLTVVKGQIGRTASKIIEYDGRIKEISG